MAAFLGLAILALLYFSQARDVRRLRDWAGRAPERAVEQGERATEVAPATAGRAALAAGHAFLPGSRAAQAKTAARADPQRPHPVRALHRDGRRGPAGGRRRGVRRGPADRRRRRHDGVQHQLGPEAGRRRQRRAATTAPAGQHRPVAGDRRGPERDDGAGPRGAGGRGGDAPAASRPGRPATRPASIKPSPRSSTGPARPAPRAPSPTGSASTRQGRSIRSTRRSPVRSTSWSWSAPIDNEGSVDLQADRPVCGGTVVA